MAIPLSVNTQQLGLRLLELPPELLELLESKDAPILQLKSSEGDHSDKQSAANAVLCTPNRTYDVRQVMSSNVLYILQQNEESGFTAIAQCKGMLELVPSHGDAKDHLRKMIPICDKDVISSSTTTRESVEFDAPYSHQELEKGLTELCAFEKDDSMWLASPAMLWTAWRSLLTASTISGVTMDETWTIKELEKQVVEDGIETEVFRAMIRRLTKLNNDEMEASLDQLDTSTWVGEILLGAQTEPLPKNEFMNQWRDALPENWRNTASLHLIQDKYTIAPDGSIRAISGESKSTDAKKIETAARSKWHQKFRK